MHELWEGQNLYDLVILMLKACRLTRDAWNWFFHISQACITIIPTLPMYTNESVQCV